MAEFILNPRRAPRAPARCRAAVLAPDGRFEAETEDIGSMGCQVVAPTRVRKGDRVELVFTNERLDGPLEVTGRVAWVSACPPWRVGIAFEEGSVAGAGRWFERLVAADPALGRLGRVPDRIRTDQTVYLGPPPRFLVDFTADEAMLLRAIASGARVDELMARLRDRWAAALRALFSLIARQAVTLQRGQAVHPDSWKKILTEVEASLAVESLGRAPAALAAPAAEPAAPPPAPAPPLPPGEARRHEPAPSDGGWTGGDPHDPTRVVELADDGSPLDLAVPAPVPGAAAWVDPSRVGPRRDHAGAGVGWRRAAAPGRRSVEAQSAYDRGCAELRAGNITGALAFLRLAISLAPGDPEIAQQLGTLAFKDRLPGDR